MKKKMKKMKAAKRVIYEAFVEGKFETPKYLARTSE